MKKELLLFQRSAFRQDTFLIWRRFQSTKPVNYDSEKYQFLQKSEIPTYHFQKSLRRLPIPKLEDSCRRYLNAVQAVVSESEFKDSEKVVKDFLNGEGPELHKELLVYDKKNKHTSYISEPWFDLYLTSRVPCPVNYNPFMMFAPDPDPEFNNQLVRATNFVLAMGRFKKSLDAECLAPEVFHLNPKKSDTAMFRRVCRILPSNVSWFGAVAFKAFPLDMSQYSSLFGGNRIPQKGKDRLHLKRDSRHFLVMRNGNFYTVDLFDSDGKMSKAQLKKWIAEFLEGVFTSDRKVLYCQPCAKQVIFNAYSIGRLVEIAKVINGDRANVNIDPDLLASMKYATLMSCDVERSFSVYKNLLAENRINLTPERLEMDEVRQELLTTDEKNLISLRQIDDALFVLCLDDLESQDPIRLVNSLLCGDDGSNRWFDKCFQVIMDKNGQATINFEHSWGDGVAVLRLMEETLKDSIVNRFVTPAQDINGGVQVGEYLHKLDWTLNDSIRQKIQNAQQEHLERCKDLQFGTMEYMKMNRDTIKGYKLSPDSMMQLAIQMAFYGTYKEFVPTYESCSTAAFFKGRTECVRSATLATRETVLALENKQSQMTKANLFELFKKCSDVHSRLVKEGAMGQGFDRHLLGLKITANRLNRPLPAFLQDKTYQKMNNFVLSTSTLSTDTIVFGGFGPVVQDGFGIGYNVVGSKLGAVVSSYKSKRNAEKFCESLASSLDTIRNVLETK